MPRSIRSQRGRSFAEDDGVGVVDLPSAETPTSLPGVSSAVDEPPKVRFRANGTKKKMPTCKERRATCKEEPLPVAPAIVSQNKYVTNRADADTGDWSQLPEVVWTRVVHGASIEDLPAVAMALPCSANWREVAELRWPSQQLLGNTANDSQGVVVDLVRQVVSLCVASRAVLGFLHWPQAATSPWPNATESPGFSSPFSAPVAMSPLVASDVGSPLPPQKFSGDATAGSLNGYICPAIQELSAGAGEPVNIPVDTSVFEGGICMDNSLIVILCRGGFFRAIRRSDLKQVCGLTIREAISFDFQGELLVVGTAAPARLVAYDLSVPKPSKPSNQLRLDAGSGIDVTCMFFVGAFRFVCGLQHEDRPILDEVRLVSCEDDGFVFLHRLCASCISPLGIRGVSVVSEGKLSAWNIISQNFDPDMRTDLQSMHDCTGNRTHMLASGASSRFVVVGGGNKSVSVHDLSNPCQQPFLLEFSQFDLASGQGNEGSGQDVSSLARPPLQYCIRDLHVDGSVLLVLADGEYNLSDVDPAGGFEFMYVSAWHLPSRRPLLSNLALRGNITAFSRSSIPDTDRTLAFAVQLPTRRGYSGNCVVLPGSNATKVRTGRKVGMVGPQKHTISSSDARARRSGGMHKR